LTSIFLSFPFISFYFSLSESITITITIHTARKPFRYYQFAMLGTIGLVAGTMTALLRSSQRLMGVSENSREVSFWGVAPAAEVEEATRRRNYANIDLVESKR